MTSRAYGARSPCSYYDVILIVTSFATELATPTVTYVRTYIRYGHLIAFNIIKICNRLPITAINQIGMLRFS